MDDRIDSEKWYGSDIKPKRRYYKPFDKKRAEAFREKFAIDSKWHGMKLTAHGCFQRHNQPRSEQLMTHQESAKRNFENISQEEWNERRLVSDMANYLAMGFVMGAEHPDEFVARCREENGDDDERN